MSTFTGAITPQGVLSGTISSIRKLSGVISAPSGSFAPIYDGSYEITPLAFTETIMETEGKRMADDVSVSAIPYFETTNESGGYTVIIG